MVTTDELTQNRHPRQELLVHLSLPDGGAHQNAPVAVPIDTPQFDVGFGTDRGSSRSSIDEGQLAEAAALADCRYQLIVNEYLAALVEGNNKWFRGFSLLKLFV